MNITKIYNSILPTYDKSGYNNKKLFFFLREEVFY